MLSGGSIQLDVNAGTAKGGSYGHTRQRIAAITAKATVSLGFRDCHPPTQFTHWIYSWDNYPSSCAEWSDRGVLGFSFSAEFTVAGFITVLWSASGVCTGVLQLCPPQVDHICQLRVQKNNLAVNTVFSVFTSGAGAGLMLLGASHISNHISWS